MRTGGGAALLGNIVHLYRGLRLGRYESREGDTKLNDGSAAVFAGAADASAWRYAHFVGAGNRSARNGFQQTRTGLRGTALGRRNLTNGRVARGGNLIFLPASGTPLLLQFSRHLGLFKNPVLP